VEEYLRFCPRCFSIFRKMRFIVEYWRFGPRCFSMFPKKRFIKEYWRFSCVVCLNFPLKRILTFKKSYISPKSKKISLSRFLCSKKRRNLYQWHLHNFYMDELNVLNASYKWFICPHFILKLFFLNFVFSNYHINSILSEDDF
jgi:hypothetical protein